jgi:hypothetical protein
MRAFNVRGVHLTGADRRNLARQYRRYKRSHNKMLRRALGGEAPSEIARINQLVERELFTVDAGRPTSAAVYANHGTSHPGNPTLDFVWWSGEPARHPEGRYAVVRF